MKNIMDTLTPKPPQQKKRGAIDFGTPKFVNAIKAKTKIIKGINRTKDSLK